MRFILGIALLFTPLAIFSQLNESDTTDFQLNARVGGSTQMGNVEFIRVVGSLESTIRLKSGVWVFKTQNNYLFQKILRNKADEDFNTMNFFYFKPINRIYPYAIISLSTNFRRDIQLRSFGGLGVTYQVLVKPKHNLKVSTNFLYENTSYSLSNFNIESFNNSSIVSSVMNSVYISGYHQLFNTKVGLAYEGYYQRSLSERELWRYHLVATLNFNIANGLSVNTKVNFTYEHLIALNNQRKDLIWTWGISYLLKR